MDNLINKLANLTKETLKEDVDLQALILGLPQHYAGEIKTTIGVNLSLATYLEKDQTQQAYYKYIAIEQQLFYEGYDSWIEVEIEEVLFNLGFKKREDLEEFDFWLYLPGEANGKKTRNKLSCNILKQGEPRKITLRLAIGSVNPQNIKLQLGYLQLIQRLLEKEKESFVVRRGRSG